MKQLELCFSNYCTTLSSRLDVEELDARSLSFYVFMLFVSGIEIIMTFQYVAVVNRLEIIDLNEWFWIGLQIEFLAFYTPTRVLLLYSSLTMPIMKAYTKTSRFAISLTQVLGSFAPSEMISFFA